MSPCPPAQSLCCELLFSSKTFSVMLTELQDGKYMWLMTVCLLNWSQDLKKYEKLEIELHVCLILQTDVLWFVVFRTGQFHRLGKGLWHTLHKKLGGSQNVTECDAKRMTVSSPTIESRILTLPTEVRRFVRELCWVTTFRWAEANIRYVIGYFRYLELTQLWRNI